MSGSTEGPSPKYAWVHARYHMNDNNEVDEDPLSFPRFDPVKTAKFLYYGRPELREDVCNVDKLARPKSMTFVDYCIMSTIVSQLHYCAEGFVDGEDASSLKEVLKSAPKNFRSTLLQSFARAMYTYYVDTALWLQESQSVQLTAHPELIESNSSAERMGDAFGKMTTIQGHWSASAPIFTENVNWTIELPFFVQPEPSTKKLPERVERYEAEDIHALYKQEIEEGRAIPLFDSVGDCERFISFYVLAVVDICIRKYVNGCAAFLESGKVEAFLKAHQQVFELRKSVYLVTNHFVASYAYLFGKSVDDFKIKLFDQQQSFCQKNVDNYFNILLEGVLLNDKLKVLSVAQVEDYAKKHTLSNEEVSELAEFHKRATSLLYAWAVKDTPWEDKFRSHLRKREQQALAERQKMMEATIEKLRSLDLAKEAVSAKTDLEAVSTTAAAEPTETKEEVVRPEEESGKV
jgi:hypothetical protein